MARNKDEDAIEVRLAKSPSTIGHYQIKDHFSLSNPSSTVKFKDVECHIFSDGTEQLILEKDEDTITAKKVSEATPGLFFIRLFYSIVSSFMAGFLFIFSIQVILFLFLGVLQSSGNGNSSVFQFGKDVCFLEFFLLSCFTNPMNHSSKLLFIFRNILWFTPHSTSHLLGIGECYESCNCICH